MNNSPSTEMQPLYDLLNWLDLLAVYWLVYLAWYNDSLFACFYDSGY